MPEYCDHHWWCASRAPIPAQDNINPDGYGKITGYVPGLSPQRSRLLHIPIAMCGSDIDRDGVLMGGIASKSCNFAESIVVSG